MDNYFVVGKIVNTQGIKGEVRVLPSTDDAERFKLLDRVFVQLKNGIEEYAVENVRFHKKFVLLKLEGIDDMTSAEKLKTCDVKVSEDMAVPCGEDEYYIRDLYDMEVVTQEGECLGRIRDIIFTGANDVYTVYDGERDILIPAIKQCILNVDVEKGKMTVKLLEGLR